MGAEESSRCHKWWSGDPSPIPVPELHQEAEEALSHLPEEALGHLQLEEAPCPQLT